MKIYFHLNLDGFSNCYLVVNEVSRQALIIDPCRVTTDLLEQIERGPYSLAAVLITHSHPAHLRGLSVLRKIYTPKIYAADYEVAGSETMVLKDDGMLQIAGLRVGYLAVPGHSADSIVYKIGQALFTGDTLTAGMIGNTASSYARHTLINNIEVKILSQQEDVVIMPGHGPPSSVGAEKKFNAAFAPAPDHEPQQA
ncbi:MAG TPA: MBL fold metallo-hydrolase [Candidatus Treponema faecavium]|nr:MBL fold metallo-hydrolase [Candidatus Treponema faecavium]